ncbi:MAG: efflux RND transporter permease subunit, partial [Spirochaetales bacterium]|nr:efflux RND transporter permease subunit [Spirochaetales bacterium]
ITTTNVEFVSEINMPQVYVVSIWPGASSEDIEKEVINVLEDDFVTLPDFRSISSSASNSVGITIISFADGINPEDKIQDVRDRIRELEDDLPDDLSGLPQCMVGGSAMLSTATFAVYGGEDLGAVSKYVEDTLKPRITQIDGVSKIDVSGTAEARVNVELRIKDLESKGINPLAVYQMLGYSNNSIPLGSSMYEEKKVNLKYDGTFTSLDDIRNLPVGATDEGQIIRLSDVADVSISYPERDYYVRSEGEDVIVVDVFKRSDGNAIKITNQINNVLEECGKETGGAIKFKMIAEDKTTVTNSLSTVIQSGVMGILIAILVIFLFLNDIRATMVIGVSIPLSIFFTFIGMKLMGLTVNILSISGMVVALGSIVDASIVVIDETYRFYQQTKNGNALYNVTQSIDNGTDKVGLSVLGSNLTTVVVFIPITMISSLVGKLLHDVSITFMISILASLIVALVFVPWLMKKFLKEGDEYRVPKNKSIVVKGVDKLEKGYNIVLKKVLKDPFFIILISIGILFVTGYTLTQQKMAFIPSTDNSDFNINIKFPYGYTLEDTDKGMRMVEEIVNDYLPSDDVKTSVTYVGRQAGSIITLTSSPNEGGMHIVLVPVKDRDWDIHSAINDLQYMLEEKVPGAEVDVANGGFDRYVNLMSNGGGFGVTLTGNDSDELYKVAEEIRDYLNTDPQVIKATISATYDDVSAVMNANYDNLSSLGLTSYQSAMTNAILFNGTDIGTFTDPETKERFDIHLSSDVSDYPVNESLLSILKISGETGNVSVDTISDITLESELSQIAHTDRSPSMTVNAKIMGESTTDISARFNEYLAMNPLPEGIKIKETGLGDLVKDSVVPIAQAMIIGVFLVYFVMVMVFERYNQPLQVMITVPFCIIGVTLSLAVFGTTLNMIAILGIVSLMGMLVNNGIILIDSINQLYNERRNRIFDERGIDYKDLTDKEKEGRLDYSMEMDILNSSVVDGTSSRLRPILMSSLTTILGVIPMAIARGEGAELYAPLGQVIMGGLMTSMIITLFITPVVFFVFERRKLKKIYKKMNKITEANK